MKKLIVVTIACLTLAAPTFGAPHHWPWRRHPPKAQRRGKVLEAGSYPLLEGDIAALLKVTAEARNAAILPQLINSSGIAFDPSAKAIESLRRAGGSDAVVAAVKEAKRVPWPEGASLSPSKVIYIADEDAANRYQREKLLYGPIPVYPLIAKMRRVQGDVELWVVVGVDGEVKDVKEVSRPLGEYIDEGAVFTVMKWRFQQTQEGETPVEVHEAVKVTYRLVE